MPDVSASPVIIWTVIILGVLVAVAQKVPIILGPIGEAMDKRREKKAAAKAALVSETKSAAAGQLASLEAANEFYRELADTHLADLRRCQSARRDSDRTWADQLRTTEADLVLRDRLLVAHGIEVPARSELPVPVVLLPNPVPPTNPEPDEDYG